MHPSDRGIDGACDLPHRKDCENGNKSSLFICFLIHNPVKLPLHLICILSFFSLKIQPLFSARRTFFLNKRHITFILIQALNFLNSGRNNG